MQKNHKVLTRFSSGNRLRGPWHQIFIIHSRRSGFSNKLETSPKIMQNFLIVHELIKATFEDAYIFSFDCLLRQVIPDINGSMMETILPYIKTSPYLENFEGISPCHVIFPQAYKIKACIWFEFLCENLECFNQITPESSISQHRKLNINHIHACMKPHHKLNIIFIHA